MYQSRYGLPQSFRPGISMILSLVLVSALCIGGSFYLFAEVGALGLLLAVVPFLLLLVLPTKLDIDFQAVTISYLARKKVYKLEDIADVEITREYVRTRHGERTVRLLMLTMANGRRQKLNFPGPPVERLKALIRQGIERAGDAGPEPRSGYRSRR